MNTSQIEYLVVATRTSSFAEAGRQLHVTSQAISKAIKALEDECGCRLFLKEGKGVQPTTEALAIARRAEPFLDSLADLQAFILCAAHRDVPHVTLGITAQGHRGRLLQESDATALVASMPEAHIKFLYGTSGYCREAVAAGILDAALVPGVPANDGIRGIRVGALRLHAVLNMNATRERARHVALEHIAMHPIAYPIDIPCIYRTLAHTLHELHPTGPASFTYVDDEQDAYRSFLEKGGAILTLDGDDIAGMEPDTAHVTLQPETLPSLPMFLIFRKQHASQLMAQIAARLARISA